MITAKKSLRIGGASGFWGDASHATAQLLTDKTIDFIVYDYLAEITMSIMARARAKDPSMGYAADFVSAAIKPNLQAIKDQGVRIVANAGGVNPIACATALRNAISESGLNLNVACVLGDDLIDQKEDMQSLAPKEMFSGDTFPPLESIQSINAYLGAFPIAKALDEGADIVVTGRCVDSAVTLGACIHHFGWDEHDVDKLAGGSLAGHIIECGPQATGGNFTDWELAGKIDDIGYPIAEVSEDGSFTTTKPASTTGLVSVGTVAEQMVYEIGDPQAYILPDVICDFSQVTLEQLADNVVKASGAKGLPAPNSYKVCSTYADGFRGGTTICFYGHDADKKARSMAEAVFRAASRTLKSYGLPDYSETSIELIGAEDQFGEYRQIAGSRELYINIAAKHPIAPGIGILLKEAVGLGLATPPGLCGFAGGRPKPSPVVRLFSFALPKSAINIQIDLGEKTLTYKDSMGTLFNPASIARPVEPKPIASENLVEVPLYKLAWARSGDKGNKSNVGVIARQAEYLPYIWAALDEQTVQSRFAHFLGEVSGDTTVQRFLMPGSHAINFLMDDALGGGGIASLRNDPQGKGYGQILLATNIPVTNAIAESL